MSKMFRQYGIFLLIPGITSGFSVSLKLAAGPYWLATNFDPSYQYLINGLYLLKGVVPNHTDHPGTPLQMLCGAVCWLFNIGRPMEDIATRVLTSPEFYMHVVFGTLTLFSFLTSVALGAYVFHKTNDKWAAVLTQLPALNFLIMKSWESPEPVLPVVANLCPEPMLMSMLNLFNICLFMSFYAESKKDKLIAALTWGFVCGFGVAIKFTIMPLLLTPLIILSWKNRMFFICIFMASFFVWTLPVFSKLTHVWSYLNVFLMKNQGNAGTAGRVNEIHNYCVNFSDFIIAHGVFTGLVFLALLSVIWKLARNEWGKTSFYLLAISLGAMIQFVVVAQYPKAHYLLPGLGMLSPLLVLLYFQGPSGNNLGRRIVPVLILATVFLGTWRAIEYRAQLAGLTKDILTFYDHIHSEYKGYVVLRYYRSSGQDQALLFADGWNAEFQFKKELFRLYPNSYFFDPFWNDRIVNFDDRVLSNDLLDQSSGILFQADDSYDLNNFLVDSPFTVRLLEKGRFESVYILTGTTEKQAVVTFAAAMHFLQAEDYQQALDLALQAKALHYQPKDSVDTFIKVVTPYVQSNI